MLVVFFALIAVAILWFALSALFSSDLDDWAEDDVEDVPEREEPRPEFEPVAGVRDIGTSELIVVKGGVDDDADDDKLETVTGAPVEAVTDDDADKALADETGEDAVAGEANADDPQPVAETPAPSPKARPRVDYLSGGAGDENLFGDEGGDDMADAADAARDFPSEDEDGNIFGDAAEKAEHVEARNPDQDEEPDKEAVPELSKIAYRVDEARIEVIDPSPLMPFASATNVAADVAEIEDAIEVAEEDEAPQAEAPENVLGLDTIRARADADETAETDDVAVEEAVDIYDSYGADDPVVIEDFDPRVEALNILAKNECAIGPPPHRAGDPVAYSLTEKDGNVEIRVDGGLIAVLKGVSVDDLKVSSYPGDPEVENPNLSLCYASADVPDMRWPAQAV